MLIKKAKEGHLYVNDKRTIRFIESKIRVDIWNVNNTKTMHYNSFQSQSASVKLLEINVFVYKI